MSKRDQHNFTFFILYNKKLNHLTTKKSLFFAIIPGSVALIQAKCLFFFIYGKKKVMHRNLAAVK